MSLTYQELLRTPQWEEFSTRMKKAAGWQCSICGHSGPGITLNVHHHFSERTRAPWDYAADEVTVCCDWCHRRLHEQLQRFRREIFGQLQPDTFTALNTALAAIFASQGVQYGVKAIADLARTIPSK